MALDQMPALALNSGHAWLSRAASDVSWRERKAVQLNNDFKACPRFLKEPGHFDLSGPESSERKPLKIFFS